MLHDLLIIQIEYGNSTMTLQFYSESIYVSISIYVFIIDIAVDLNIHIMTSLMRTFAATSI